MRFLVVGAGATGGYFGGRLLEAGCDVTFLVRPARKERLAAHGLSITSPAGNVAWNAPPVILASELSAPFDAVILSCKACDLEQAIESFAPAVGANTVVVPLLNGMRHLETLDACFGAERVLGGSCFISAKLDARGHINHVSDIHRLNFGERAGGLSPRVESLAAAMRQVKFEAVASDHILQVMWEKWVFLATLAGITCLARASIGDLVSVGGVDLPAALFDECRAIATAAGFPPSADSVRSYLGRLTDPLSTVTASMLDDLERRGRTEADHVLGDLLRRASDPNDQRSLLRLAYLAVKAAETRIDRESRTV